MSAQVRELCLDNVTDLRRFIAKKLIQFHRGEIPLKDLTACYKTCNSMMQMVAQQVQYLKGPINQEKIDFLEPQKQAIEFLE